MSLVIRSLISLVAYALGLVVVLKVLCFETYSLSIFDLSDLKHRQGRGPFLNRNNSKFSFFFFLVKASSVFHFIELFVYHTIDDLLTYVA